MGGPDQRIELHRHVAWIQHAIELRRPNDPQGIRGTGEAHEHLDRVKQHGITGRGLSIASGHTGLSRDQHLVDAVAVHIHDLE